MTRRQFLNASGTVVTATCIGFTRTALAAPSVQVLETRLISQEPQMYHGWPTLTRRCNGQLVLVYSGGREQHSVRSGAWS
jgi:sialidase-1